MTGPEIVDQALLDRVLAAARASPRLRRNHNFHDSTGHPCQRLLNAVVPGTYIQPHRHLDPGKDEMLVILRGSLGLVFFDEAGAVTGTVLLAAGGATIGANIPTRQFHAGVVLEPAVVLEVKAGPYAPNRPDEKAGFAPEEGAPGAAEYLARLRRLFDAA